VSDEVFTLNPIDFALVDPDYIIPLDQEDSLNPDDYEYPYDYDYFDTSYDWAEYDEDYETISTDEFCAELHNEFNEELGWEEVDNICQDMKWDFGSDIDVQTTRDIISDIWDYLKNNFSQTISTDEFCAELHNEFDEKIGREEVDVICQSIDIEFSSDGGGLGLPRGIAVDSSGSIYVAEFDNNSIQKFDSDGNFLFTFGKFGSDDGQFNGPSVVAVDDSGNIYVADTGNNRIQKFDSNGNFLLKFGVFGSDEGQFYFPQDITVDSSGNIYVADTFNNRIQKFDSYGNFLSTLNSTGSNLDPQKYDDLWNYLIDYFGNESIECWTDESGYVICDVENECGYNDLDEYVCDGDFYY